jgi:hypothetical protein
MTGCGAQGGAALYMLGVGGDQKVKAEFKLPKTPMVILVDDAQDQVQPSTAKLALVDKLATELKAQKMVDRVTTNDEIQQLRQTQPDFDKLTIREVGRLARADTMIWIDVQSYSVNDDPDLTVSPGKMAARLKVFNIKEADKSKVRLWPPQREGRIVDAEVSAHLIRRCKSKQEVHTAIGEELAVKIAQLFYDHSLEPH